MHKSLTELSLNISEAMYRELPQLSHSTLVRYEKGGFSSISKLFEEIQPTESIIFGSLVDTIITDKSNFDNKFIVATFDVPTESIKNVLDALSDSREIAELITDLDEVTSLGEERALTLEDVEDSIILEYCNYCKFQPNFKDNTRVDKIRAYSGYFDTLQLSKGKIIVDPDMYYTAMQTVNALLDGPTSKYLQPKSEGGKVEFLYQQKFTTTLDGLDVKMMADLLIVNHEMKMIIPIDLKTTGMPEYCFPHKYLDNRYDIQAKLYWHILRNVLDKDNYFKDFKLLNFRFIVVNKNSLTPLVFEDDRCTNMTEEEIIFKSGRKLILRNPITIGKELKHYLDTAATLPDGFTQDKPVNIYEVLINE